MVDLPRAESDASAPRERADVPGGVGAQDSPVYKRSPLLAGRWALATLVLGLGLWGVLVGNAVVEELAFSDGRLWLTAINLAAPLLLLGGLWRRSAALLFFAYPASMVPAYIFQPMLEREAHLEGEAILASLAMVALYAGTTAMWLTRLGDQGSDGQGGRLAGEVGQAEVRFYGSRAWDLGSRAAALTAQFGVIVYAVLLAPEISATLERFYPDHERMARTFMLVALGFAWCVGMYAMVLLPAMTMDYDAQRLHRTPVALPRFDERSRVHRRLGWMATALLLALLGWWALPAAA